MEGDQFDALSRRLGSSRSRRGALKALAGAVVAAITGTRAASAQGCTGHYAPCSGDTQCCAGAVCEYGLCMPGCRIDGAFTSALMSPPENVCVQCRPELSTTSWTPANEGISCWSGDPNAGATYCQNGACAPNGPAQCPPPPPCHTDQLLDPATCAYAVAEAGTPCGGQAMCHGEFYTPADTCDGNGFCIGGGSQTVPCAPYRCGTGACTTSCSADADCAPGAYCDEGRCYALAELGQPCEHDRGCRSGICVNGICCDEPCEGLCEACSAETGGHCRQIVCEDDGLSCTTGVCDTQTGTCSHALISGFCLIDGVCYPDGTIEPSSTACDVACDAEANPTGWSPHACIPGEVCMSGACVSTITGELVETDPRLTCDHPSGMVIDVPYHLHPFHHQGGHLYVSHERTGGDFEPHLTVATEFDPANPCGNLVGGYTLGDCGLGLYSVKIANLPDLPAGDYVVVTGGTGSSFGPYKLRFHPQFPSC